MAVLFFGFFLVKDQMVSTLGFEGHTVSFTDTELCHCSMSTIRHSSNQYAWLHFNKTLFAKTGKGRDVARKLQFANLIPEQMIFLNFFPR